jgi:signal recognition particle subunit SRP54
LGQRAGVQAREFAKGVGITGVIVTKMEGTAKGGGALVSCAASGASIKCIGVGEKLDDLEPFDPDGFVSRLLGWGDIKSLIRKAEEAAREHVITPEQMLEDFDLDIFLKQMEAAKSMGPLKGILQMMGMTDIPKELVSQSEEKMKKFKFIIESMTRAERKDPDIINNSRMERIAKGSGSSQQEVRDLLSQFKQTRKMMKLVKKGRLPKNLAGRIPGGMKQLQGALGGAGGAKFRNGKGF